MTHNDRRNQKTHARPDHRKRKQKSMKRKKPRGVQSQKHQRELSKRLRREGQEVFDG